MFKYCEKYIISIIKTLTKNDLKAKYFLNDWMEIIFKIIPVFFQPLQTLIKMHRIVSPISQKIF